MRFLARTNRMQDVHAYHLKHIYILGSRHFKKSPYLCVARCAIVMREQKRASKGFQTRHRNAQMRNCTSSLEARKTSCFTIFASRARQAIHDRPKRQRRLLSMLLQPNSSPTSWQQPGSPIYTSVRHSHLECNRLRARHSTRIECLPAWSPCCE